MGELLPNYKSAVIDLNKLIHYSLNTDHPEGKYKAFVFLSVFGMGQEEASELQSVIFDAVKLNIALIGKEDKFGKRYSVEFAHTRNQRKAIIKTAWIIRIDEDFPRLTSCWIDREK